MYKIYIFMQCAPNTYEFFQPMFGLRANVEIGEMSTDFDTSLIDRLISYILYITPYILGGR